MANIFQLFSGNKHVDEVCAKGDGEITVKTKHGLGQRTFDSIADVLENNGYEITHTSNKAGVVKAQVDPTPKDPNQPKARGLFR